jgi:hypothetical protein
MPYKLVYVLQRPTCVTQSAWWPCTSEKRESSGVDGMGQEAKECLTDFSSVCRDLYVFYRQLWRQYIY